MEHRDIILQEEKCWGNGFEYFGEANSTYQEAQITQLYDTG